MLMGSRTEGVLGMRLMFHGVENCNASSSQTQQNLLLVVHSIPGAPGDPYPVKRTAWSFYIQGHLHRCRGCTKPRQTRTTASGL